MDQRNPRFDSTWVHAATSRAAFKREQARLGGLWTLLGLTTDLPREGDWFRATLGGRSVFVQRFDDGLRGFENVCAHRFYPLRIDDKGNGPIRCGFHHWQYNKDGLAVGIPHCQEMYHVTPRELGARLKPVEIATCGILIFGRFAGGPQRDTLADSLGEAFPIVEAMCNATASPYTIQTPVAANWKLLFHISLDDYHIVAVHPDSFGKHGYLALDSVRYFRFGLHSAYFNGAGQQDNELARMAERCRDGNYRPSGYRIFQFFPNLLVLHINAGMNWYVLIQQYVPLSHERTLARCWYFPAPFPPDDRNWVAGLMRRVAAPFVPQIFELYARKIFREDNAVCEQLQTTAPQIEGSPTLGRHEERIAWFEDVYSNLVVESGETG